MFADLTESVTDESGTAGVDGFRHLRILVEQECILGECTAADPRTADDYVDLPQTGTALEGVRSYAVYGTG